MLAIYIIRVNTRLFFCHTHLCYILNPILAFIPMTFTLLPVFLVNVVVTSVSKIRALSQFVQINFEYIISSLF